MRKVAKKKRAKSFYPRGQKYPIPPPPPPFWVLHPVKNFFLSLSPYYRELTVQQFFFLFLLSFLTKLLFRSPKEPSTSA